MTIFGTTRTRASFRSIAAVTFVVALLSVSTPASAGRFRRGVVTGLAVGAVVHSASGAAAHWREGQAATGASAAPAGACNSQVPLGRSPTFVDAARQSGLHLTCYSEYTVAFSEKTRTPLWSAEYLTAQRIQAARRVARKNTFHEETALPPEVRSQLKDYVRSGYDRGHMSPSGDFTNEISQNESYSLVNMIPQEPNNNRHLWEGIESGTRNFAVSNGSVYVVTGPLFSGKKISFLNDRVAIPTQIFKLLYDPIHKSGGVFLVGNTDTQQIAWLAISDFERQSGIRFGMGAPPLMQMPTPQQHFKQD